MRDVLQKRRRGFIVYLIGALLLILSAADTTGNVQAMLSASSDATTRENRSKGLPSCSRDLCCLRFFITSHVVCASGSCAISCLTFVKLDFAASSAFPCAFSRANRGKSIFLSNLVNDINIIEKTFFSPFLNVLFNGGLALFGFLISSGSSITFSPIVLALTIGIDS